MFIEIGRLGSGNNWACGYRNGSLAEENILNSLQWQLEHADRIDTILPILSLAGGTGKLSFLFVLLEQDVFFCRFWSWRICC